MKQLITAIKNLDFPTVMALHDLNPELISWAEPSGKNALHYLGEVNVTNRPDNASLEILRYLLNRGADMNSVHTIKDEGDTFPATPLWYAYAHGHNQEMVNYLLEQGADPQNCMFAVAWNDDPEGAALFQKYGAAIDPEFNHSTPFFAAFLWKKFAVAEWFANNGANINYADEDGRTTLFHAVKKRFTPAQIETLLKYGADPKKEDKQGVSPLGVAQRNREHRIVNMFNEASPTT